MAAEKVTPMVLKVDLQCPCCYKKIKKTLCKFPQIRDQVYDEKANKVFITVVCCSPEKIRDKLCCKGGKTIKSIEIVDKPKEPEKKPKEPEKKPKAADKSKEPEKPKSAEKPKEKAGEPEKAKGDAKPKDAPKPEVGKKAAPVAMPPAAMQVMGPGPAVVHGVPSVFPYAGSTYDGYHGYGFPPAAQPILYEGGYYGQGYYGGGVGHVNRSDNYFTDENPQTCSIM